MFKITRLLFSIALLSFTLVAQGQVKIGENTAGSYAETTLGLYATNYSATSTNTRELSDRLFSIGNGTSNSNRSNALTLLKNGNLGLGTDSPAYTLQVSGTIGVSGDITNTSSNTVYTHADYVFEHYFDGQSAYQADYRMPSLPEVEAFVKENKHLPGIQSREDIRQNGWNITKNVSKNLEKIEELYLHTISQQKVIDAQQKTIEAQQKDLDVQGARYDALEKEVEQLKQLLLKQQD